ncbi:MAG: MBL fold metallo-hydrolase [Hyphomicrobiales bacterium]|nr:MBL fold metallo-hydrolase [Hyphomicrobiales bacterium]
MSDDLTFDRRSGARAGEVVQVSPLIRRVIAPNPGPFTFTGTCSYIVGQGTVAVIDPGPESDAHLSVLLAALTGETVSHIVVSHTHRDHSPGAIRLQAATGARIVGCGIHRATRLPALGETNRLEASSDIAYQPDAQMSDGDMIEGRGWTLEAVATPGHTANHLAFALREDNALFSADHVMAWSTSIVAPPDGAMADYMVSLDKLRARSETVYWPGHGGPVRDPQRFVRALATHRRMREASILARIEAGDRLIGEIVPKVYEGLDPALHGAAALSTLAHLEDLVSRGLIRCAEASPSLEGHYLPLA